VARLDIHIPDNRPESQAGDIPFIHRILCGALAFAAALIWSLVWAGPLQAMDLTAELSAGYDSNPALSDPADGSGFSVYGGGGGYLFKWSEDLMLDVSVEGRYQDYWQVEDNYRIQAGTALTYAMAGGRFLAALLGEAAAYRDDLIEADARNEGVLGIGADWILTNRLTLGFEQTCRWLSYLNWARPFSGKGQGRGADKAGKGGKQGKHPSSVSPAQGRADPLIYRSGSGKGKGPLQQLYPPRDNRLLYTGVDLDIFILPSLTSRVYAAYGDLNSSLDLESYWELQAGLGVSWVPEAHWRVGFEARGSRVRYDRVPANMTRVRQTNTIGSLGMDVSRYWGHLELFGQLEWTWGEAPLDYHDYTQTVILCGISYLF